MATAELEHTSRTPQPPPDGLQLLDRRHVAYMLGKTVSYVDALLAAGLVPGAVKGISGRGRARKFIRAKIEEWIAAGCPRPAKR
jgi:predicted DNA-binding transcriptional regulator AlpA